MNNILKILFYATFTALIVFSTGCVSFETETRLAESKKKRDILYQRLIETKKKLKDKNSRELAYLKEDLRIIKDKLTKVTTNNNQIVDAIKTFDGKLISLEKNFSILQEKMQEKILTVEKKLSLEKELREKTINELINQFSRELSATTKKFKATQENILQAVSGVSVAAEYKVQRGDTLSVIAKAYGISIASLKQANNLKTDIIIPGQILVIPNK
ncbi:MAG: LysM peptidoglycan-binding domain-containing protein [Verrucomicrobiota bacterium]|nr:LysM peptidoglycan-binding domain-containing protein [Verrucomicrobiota bacterium]